MGVVVKCYGITQDPETKEFMLIMEYANGGNLHNYLQKNFRNITWEKSYPFYGSFQKGIYINYIH